MIEELIKQVEEFNSEVTNMQLQQQGLILTKEQAKARIDELERKCAISARDLEIVTNALQLLGDISDEAVSESYAFIESNINDALARVFSSTERRIKLSETLYKKKYKQLEVELYTASGRKRSFDSSGHGLAQLVSFLCTACIIVITGSRRIMLLDEVFSGMSADGREAIRDIMQAFTEIGFQFIICEHGFIPKGANVIELKMENEVTSIKSEYIEEHGVYLDGTDYQKNKRKEMQMKIEELEEIEEAETLKGEENV